MQRAIMWPKIILANSKNDEFEFADQGRDSYATIRCNANTEYSGAAFRSERTCTYLVLAFFR